MDHVDKSLRFDGFSFDNRLYIVDVHVCLLFLTATSHSVSSSYYLNIQFVYGILLNYESLLLYYRYCFVSSNGS